MQPAPQFADDLGLFLPGPFLQNGQPVFERDSGGEQRRQPTGEDIDIERFRRTQPEPAGSRFPERTDHHRPLPPELLPGRGVARRLQFDFPPPSVRREHHVTQFRHGQTPVAMRWTSASVVTPAAALRRPSSSSGTIPLRSAIALISLLELRATIAL